jgi:hypothetical protein
MDRRREVRRRGGEEGGRTYRKDELGGGGRTRESRGGFAGACPWLPPNSKAGSRTFGKEEREV